MVHLNSIYSGVVKMTVVKAKLAVRVIVGNSIAFLACVLFSVIVVNIVM